MALAPALPTLPSRLGLTNPKPAHQHLRRLGLAVALVASAGLGGCAQLPAAMELASVAVGGETATTSTASNGAAARPSAKEIQEGLTYWGRRFASDPSNAETALSYAANLKFVDDKPKALAVLSRARLANERDRNLASAYGRLALEMGRLDEAKSALAVAFDPTAPDWRVLSAQGAVLAQTGDHAGAIRALQQAASLEPNNPSILNNLALAHALSGDASQARVILTSARAAGASDKRVAQNLKLVSALASEAAPSQLGTGTIAVPAAVGSNAADTLDDGGAIVGATIEAANWDGSEWGPDVVAAPSNANE